MRLHLLAAALVVAFVGPAFAQNHDSPTAMLKAFYKPYLAGEIPEGDEVFRSEWLNSLYEADAENTPEGEMGALEFDPYIDGQDWDITNLDIEELEVGSDEATVAVTFENFGQPRSITYELVFEDGGWRINDLVGENPDFTYRLSEIFEGAQD